MPQWIRNPYFRKAVDASRQLIYEAGSEKALFDVIKTCDGVEQVHDWQESLRDLSLTSPYATSLATKSAAANFPSLLAGPRPVGCFSVRRPHGQLPNVIF